MRHLQTELVETHLYGIGIGARGWLLRCNTSLICNNLFLFLNHFWWILLSKHVVSDIGEIAREKARRKGA